MYSRKEHFILERTETRGNREVRIGKFYCVYNGKTYDTLGGFRNGIRPSGLTIQGYYDTYYKSEGEGICVVCGIKDSTFLGLIDGYSKYCSRTCCNKDPEKREKVSKRFEKPGVLESFLVKRLEWLSSLSQEEKDTVSAKIYATTIANNPNHYVETGRYRNQILQEKCAADPTKRPKIVAKMLATKKERGTFANGMSGRIKSFEFNGVQYSYQGYEDIVIRYLLDKGIEFALGADVPKVDYDVAVSGIYKPDIYIPEFNLLIDVKSERTMEMKPWHLFYKQVCALKQGYNFIYLALHSKKISKDRLMCAEDCKVFEEYLDMLISSQARKGRFNDYPVIRSTLQAIGSGSAGDPVMDCDIV